MNSANSTTTQWNKTTHPVVCLDVPSCPGPAVPFLCAGRPHSSCTSQKHHSQIQTQAGWWRSALHPFITETEGGQTLATLIFLQLLLYGKYFSWVFYSLKTHDLPHLSLVWCCEWLGEFSVSLHLQKKNHFFNIVSHIYSKTEYGGIRTFLITIIVQSNPFLRIFQLLVLT